jgi:hypothetical protein
MRVWRRFRARLGISNVDFLAYAKGIGLRCVVRGEVADPDEAAVLAEAKKVKVLHRGASCEGLEVEASPVVAAQILGGPHTLVEPNQAVLARYARVFDLEVAIGAASDDEVLVIELAIGHELVGGVEEEEADHELPLEGRLEAGV